MKRLLLLLLCAALLLPGAAAEAAEPLPQQLTLAPGESRVFQLPFQGYWESEDQDVAQGEGDTLTACAEGSARLTLCAPDGREWPVDVTVTADDTPALIRAAIDLALSEWQTYHGRTFEKKNKYTAWWCGTGPKCWFGWCGGFVNYCLDTVGVPMDEPAKSVPHESGEPYSVYAAGVGKIYTGFEKMNRLSKIPRPGYLVIYGQRDYYAFVHVGMITQVEDCGNGVYRIYTVEGNMSNRIKRYGLLYDSNAPGEKNLADMPEAERANPDIDQYTMHKKDWYVNTFCQTWQ